MVAPAYASSRICNLVRRRPGGPCHYFRDAVEEGLSATFRCVNPTNMFRAGQPCLSPALVDARFGLFSAVLRQGRIVGISLLTSAVVSAGIVDVECRAEAQTLRQ